MTESGYSDSCSTGSEEWSTGSSSTSGSDIFIEFHGSSFFTGTEQTGNQTSQVDNLDSAEDTDSRINSSPISIPKQKHSTGFLNRVNGTRNKTSDIDDSKILNNDSILKKKNIQSINSETPESHIPDIGEYFKNNPSSLNLGTPEPHIRDIGEYKKNSSSLNLGTSEPHIRDIGEYFKKNSSSLNSGTSKPHIRDIGKYFKKNPSSQTLEPYVHDAREYLKNKPSDLIPKYPESNRFLPREKSRSFSSQINLESSKSSFGSKAKLARHLSDFGLNNLITKASLTPIESMDKSDIEEFCKQMNHISENIHQIDKINKKNFNLIERDFISDVSKEPRTAHDMLQYQDMFTTKSIKNITKDFTDLSDHFSV